jgi:hypothetical protein
MVDRKVLLAVHLSRMALPVHHENEPGYKDSSYTPDIVSSKDMRQTH